MHRFRVFSVSILFFLSLSLLLTLLAHYSNCQQVAPRQRFSFRFFLLCFVLFSWLYFTVFFQRSRSLSFLRSHSVSLSLSLLLCLVSFFRPHTRKSANRLIPTGGLGRRSSGQDKVAHAPDVDVDSGVDAASQLTQTQTQTQTSTSSSLDWQTTKPARRSRIFVTPLRSQYANVTVCHGVSMRWAPPGESPLLSPPPSLSFPPPLSLLLVLVVWPWPWAWVGVCLTFVYCA